MIGASAALQDVTHARSVLALEAPFFGALALRLRLQEDASCDTAWTDGKTLGYNPEFFSSLTHAQQLGLVAHVVMHCAGGHPWRRDGRDAKRWNQACDYSINDTLVTAGFELPAGALLDAQFSGKSAEWIYDRLPEGSDDSEAPGEVRDAPSEEAETEAEWKEAVQQAAAIAQARGALPGELGRFAKAAAAPAINWRSVLQRFAQEAAKADYTWQRPNPRYMAAGLYLPALRPIAMGTIAVVVDVSGSVDQVLLDQFAAEINAISAELRPAGIDVIYCDARIQARETFGPDDKVELRMTGGGGTDFRPPFALLETEESPACLVYLTDMYGTFPTEAPSYPVLWAATTKQVGPFGETVYVG